MPGKALITNGSGLLLGPLGNVKVGFKGYDLGKTTDDTTLNKEEDRKDILYSQDGTKAADHVPTGTNYVLNATFGEINTSLLRQVLYSFTSNASEDGSGDDSGTFGRKQFCSLRDDVAGALQIAALECDGSESSDLEDLLNFYEVVPLVDENIINWGADTQRNLPVSFYIYYKEFGTSAITSGPTGAFGYYGDPAVELVPATEWPDLAGPQLVSAAASDATTIDLVFDENIALQGGSYGGGIIAKVNGEFVAPSSVVVSTTTSTLTFPASSFTAGDVIELSISAIVYEDTETTANAYAGVDSYPTTNSVP